MTLPKRAELHVRQEMVEAWLYIPGIPADVREILLAWLGDLKQELAALAGSERVRPEYSEKDH